MQFFWQQFFPRAPQPRPTPQRSINSSNRSGNCSNRIRSCANASKLSNKQNSPSTPPPQLPANEPPSPPAPSPAAGDFHDLRGIQWRGFGELDYKALDQRQPELATYGFNPGSTGNFYTGDFDLFLRSRLSEKLNVLGDLTFEETNGQNFTVDLRQTFLEYRANDHFKLLFGRYQTAVGYYNQVFRSASWLQTTAYRPLIMEYASNGGLLPTQAVGVSLAGSLPSGGLDLHYVAEYGSSNTVRPDIDGSGLLNYEDDGNHVLLGLFVRPSRLSGLQAGGSWFHDKISDNSAGTIGSRYGQTLVNAYLVYNGHGFELLNEGFLLRHAELHGPELFNMPAFYVQASRRFGHFRPFVRYQYVNANPESVFNDVLLRYGPSLGARYDFNTFVACKAQLDRTVRKNEPDLNGLHLQVAFTF